MPGYSGIHCEIDVAVCDASNETRCANGGMCVDGPGVTFSCECPAGMLFGYDQTTHGGIFNVYFI